MPGGVCSGAAGNNGLRVRKSGCVRGDSVPAVVFCCRGMSSPDGPDRFPHPGKCRMAVFSGGGSCPVFLRRCVGRGRSGAGLSARCFEPMGRWGGRPVGDGFLRGGSGRGALQEGTGTEVAPSRELTDIDKNPFGRCRTSAVLSGGAWAACPVGGARRGWPARCPVRGERGGKS